MGWLTVGKQFIKPFTKTGCKTVAQWKSGAAKIFLFLFLLFFDMVSPYMFFII